MQHEHLYQLAVEQVADYAIFMIDPHGRLASWNAGVRHVLRWDEADWVGQPISVIFPPEDAAKGDPEAELEKARQLGCAEDDRWHLRRDGTKFWSGGVTTALRDKQGNLTGFLKVMRDLTERKRAEERQATQLAVTTVLAEAPDLQDAVPKLLQAICNASGWQWGALWGVDRAAGVLRLVNLWHEPSNRLSQFEEVSRTITFAPGVGLPGRVWASGAPGWVTDASGETNFPRREAAARAGLHGALCFPASWHGEVLAVIEFFSDEVREPDEPLLGMMSLIGGQIGQFIDRKLTEERLRASEARHAAGVEAALDCIISMDHRGLVTEWNPAAERTFGYQRDEALGRELASLIIPPPLRDAHRHGLARYLSTGEGPVVGRRFEINAVRKDGTEFPVELSITRLPSHGPPAFTGYLRDITEAKRTEEALRESAARLKFALEAAQLGDWDLDLTNDTSRRSLLHDMAFGYSEPVEDWGFEKFIQHVHPEDRPEVERRFREAAAELKDWEFECRVVWPDGSVHWIAAHGSIYRTGEGRPVRMLGIVAETTPRKRAEEALRESEGHARRIIDNTLAFIGVMTPDGTLTEANATALRAGGLRREDVVGRKFWDCYWWSYDPDVQTQLRDAVARAAGGEVVRYDVVVRMAGDTRMPIDFMLSPVKDAEGHVTHLIPSGMDIAERKRAEEALRESEQWLRLGIAIAQMGTFQIDLQTDAVAVNDAGRDIYGWEPGEPLTFSKVQTHFHPDDREEVMRRVEVAFRPDGPGEFEVEQRIIRRDGATRWIRVRGRALFEVVGGERKAVRGVGTYLDITGQKEAERQREELLDRERAARVEAERASRMKDEFLATLSHELRTPLNAILGWSQILSRGARGDDEDFAEGLRVIERNARAQTQIIEDLLDMSRIISGKVRLDVQRVDLAAVVREAVATAKPSADAKGIRLQAVLDPHAGPVTGDPARLQQVMWNLLANAVKFTPKLGRIQVLLERVNSHVEVSVIDTGEGIKPEFLPHVFDRFRQADATTTRRHGGLGLGLSIVKQLVELHGGSVRVKSAGLGQGATFTVSLPLTVIHPESDPDVERRHPRVASSTEGLLDACVQIGGVKVLVVDDEPDARSLVKRLLEDCHAQVFTAASAAEAINLVRAEKPDVLVCDIGMPDEDGYSLMRRVRGLGPEHGGNVPAAALTAYARAEDRVKAVLAGFQMHLAKPVEPSELIVTVASLAGRTGTNGQSVKES